MHTYLVQVTGQSKASYEKHYTTTTWNAYNGTDVDQARQAAKEKATGVRTVQVLKDGDVIAVWNQINGWRKPATCTCTTIDNLCSRHQAEYQAQYGRASNE